MFVQRVQLFFLVLLNYSLFAIDIDENSTNVPIMVHSFLYIDKTEKLTQWEIINKGFVPNSVHALNFGIVPNVAVWVRFTLKNRSDKTLFKILEYASPETEALYFYDGEKSVQDGMFHHQPSRTTLNPIFEIRLQPYEEKTYHLRASSKISALIVNLTLWNEKDFLAYDSEHKTYIFIFLSVIATLLIYNLALFIFTKDVIYFYYIAHLGAILLFESIYLGAFQLYFFSNEVTEFFTKATIGHIILLVIPMVLFTKAFLRTSRFKRLNKFLNFYIYLLALVAVLSFDNFLFNLNIMFIFFPLAFAMILAGAYALKEGTKEAGIYLLGWSFVIVALTLSALKSLGGYNVFEDFRYVNEVAFASEALIFSIALAYRMKRLTKEKEALNEKLLKAQQQRQEELEQLVEITTRRLRESLQEKEILYIELKHRVKNNLQMLLSLIKLQIGKAQTRATKEALTMTNSRINAISQLYELLYFSEKKNLFSTQSYFENIVKNVQSVFDIDVEVSYDIQEDISAQSTIYCGLILNELVTNSFKHAFKERGKIKITSYIENQHCCLCIEDDGSGFSKETKESLGLTIVKTLTQKQLNAELIIESHNGTKFTILWKEEKHEEQPTENFNP